MGTLHFFIRLAEKVAHRVNYEPTMWKNRQLTPSNFSKELVLRHNLRPLHILEKSLISEVLDRQKGTEFIRKEMSVNLVVSKDLEISAAVNSYQQKFKTWRKKSFSNFILVEKIKKCSKYIIEILGCRIIYNQVIKCFSSKVTPLLTLQTNKILVNFKIFLNFRFLVALRATKNQKFCPRVPQ